MILINCVCVYGKERERGSKGEVSEARERELRAKFFLSFRGPFHVRNQKTHKNSSKASD